MEVRKKVDVEVIFVGREWLGEDVGGEVRRGDGDVE